jgi:hypothetical protein
MKEQEFKKQWKGGLVCLPPLKIIAHLCFVVLYEGLATISNERNHIFLK